MYRDENYAGYNIIADEIFTRLSLLLFLFPRLHNGIVTYNFHGSSNFSKLIKFQLNYVHIFFLETELKRLVLRGVCNRAMKVL